MYQNQTTNDTMSSLKAKIGDESGCFLIHSDNSEFMEIWVLILISSIIAVGTLLGQLHLTYRFFSSDNDKARQRLKSSFQILLLACTTLYLAETMARPFMVHFYATCQWEMFYVCGSIASPSKLLGNIFLLLIFVLRLKKSVENSIFAVQNSTLVLLKGLVGIFVLVILAQQVMFYVDLPYETIVAIVLKLWFSHNVMYIIVTIYVLVLFIGKYARLVTLFNSKQQQAKSNHLVNIVTRVKFSRYLLYAQCAMHNDACV